MNCSSRLLCALYAATSAGLAWTAVLEYQYGPAWAVCLFAAASLVPVIAVVRETVIGDYRRLILISADQVRRGDRADLIVRTEIDTACCERWWTSLGSDHDVNCPHRVRRSSAA
jgi:hypothetical protein